MRSLTSLHAQSLQLGRSFPYFLAAPIVLLAGCGGSGGGGSQPDPTPSKYVFDPLTPPITVSNAIASGYATTGAWMPIALDESGSTAGGFYVGSTYTAFPTAQFIGDTVSIEAAGGHYAWASYTKASGVVGTAILDISTGKIVTVDNAYLSNEGIASSDGSSALASVYDASGSDTGDYELVSATGTVTVLPIKNTPGYVVAGHANVGWTAAMYYPTSSALRATRRSSKQRAHPMDSQNIALLISPKGVVTKLQGTDPQVNCVNDNGVSAGFDTISGVDYPVRWDTSGKETAFKGLGSGGSGRVLGIAASGVMVGGIDGGSAPMLWQANGTAVNLTPEVTVSGKEQFAEGVQIQSNGKILGYGLDSSGNGGVVSITPSK